MTIPTDKLEFSIWLYKNIENPQWISSRQVLGTLKPNIEYKDVIDKLEALDLEGFGCSEKTRSIDFSLPHDSNGFFAKSLKHLLKNPKRSVQSPSRFYIAELDYLYSSANEESDLPDQIQGYFHRLELISALRDKVADYHHNETGTEKLVFITDKKLEITIKLDHKSLSPTPACKSLIENFILSDLHKDQRILILKTTLIEEFSKNGSRNISIDIEDIFSNIDKLLKRSTHNYDLFVSNFSFEKVKDELEREKLDFTIKLNNVFSSIQNQLLAIPVALVLVGSQMENTGEWDQNNFVIWLGAMVFAVLLSLLVRNQKNSLTAIRQEIDQQWRRIQSDHRSIADQLTGLYKSLDRRYQHQVWLIRTVDTLVALSLLVATVYLLWVSVPISVAKAAGTLALIGAPLYILSEPTHESPQ